MSVVLVARPMRSADPGGRAGGCIGLYVTICYETSLRSRHLDEGASRCIVGLYSDPMVSFQLNEAFKHEVIP